MIRSRPQDIMPAGSRCQSTKCKCARPTAVARLSTRFGMLNLCKDCTDTEMYHREQEEARKLAGRQTASPVSV